MKRLGFLPTSTRTEVHYTQYERARLFWKIINHHSNSDFEDRKLYLVVPLLVRQDILDNRLYPRVWFFHFDMNYIHISQLMLFLLSLVSRFHHIMRIQVLIVLCSWR